MIRRRMFFTVTPGQIDIEHADIIARRRGFIVAEFGTTQKYAQVMGTSGSSFMLGASESTRPESYDPLKSFTIVHLPPFLKGWDIITDFRGRYSLRVALYTPGSRRHCPVITEE